MGESGTGTTTTRGNKVLQQTLYRPGYRSRVPSTPWEGVRLLAEFRSWVLGKGNLGPSYSSWNQSILGQFLS
jgi:hypothetical protein